MPALNDMIVRLLLSAVLGALIGIERETHGRPAGLRTHVLVCLGSTLFTLSSYVLAEGRFDPGRITAQIVAGVGFLGAGTIIHQGSVVRGLTTAASIWTVAAIGVGVGIGGSALVLASVTALIVFVTLTYVPQIERLISGRRNERTLGLTIPRGPDSLSCVLSIIAQHNLRLVALTREDAMDRSAQVLVVRLQVRPEFDEDAFSHELAAAECVVSYRWV